MSIGSIIILSIVGGTIGVGVYIGIVAAIAYTVFSALTKRR